VNPDSEQHIRRISPSKKSKSSTKGFQVHFSRGGRLWTKFFADEKWGGKEKARRAARKFRDSLIDTIPAPLVHSPIRENATGYSLRTRKNRNGTVTQYVSASATDVDGRPLRKAFRVENDMASAVKAALDWRLAMAKRVLRARRAGK
jgi:hypothetical protein